MVVTGIIDEHVCRAVVDELAPHMETARVIEADDPEAFYPGRTRRVTGLIARSPTVRELICHPQSASMCDHFCCRTASLATSCTSQRPFP